MAYLGRGIENLSDRVVLDSLTASATADYTLQLNSVNFVPSSAESLTVSLNGVIQAPISSYTVSGSTLSFASSLSASDSIDFIIAERGITLQTPSAGSVGTSQLASSAVTNAKINDGEITNAKISSTADISPLKFGAGSILNNAFLTSSGNVNLTSTSYTTTFSTTYTPVSSSSYLYFFVHMNFFNTVQSSSSDAFARLLLDSTTTIWQNDRVGGNFSSSNTYLIHSHFGQWGRYTNSNTTQKSLALQVRLGATPTSGELSVGHSIANGQQIVIFEVAR